MSGSKKTQKGQFNTTNVDYILEGFESKVANKHVIDPFCGENDLLNWAKKHGSGSTFGIDIDESLEGPDDYVDSFQDPYEQKILNQYIKEKEFINISKPLIQFLYNGRNSYARN